MPLRGKVVVIHGGAGAIGSAVARAFAYEGARVFLAGRTHANLDRVARQIAADGGKVEAAEVDALDERAVDAHSDAHADAHADAHVDAHADAVAADAGGIDIALNAIGALHVQGVAFADRSLHDFEHPVGANTRSNFLTARAAARHMVKRRGGVILTLSTPGARLSGSGFMSNGVATARLSSMSGEGGSCANA